MKKIFSKKAKEVKLTNEERVASAKQKISSSLAMFRQINEDIEEANATLENVIEEETKRVIEIERNRDNAHDELRANKALQEKLEAFIK